MGGVSQAMAPMENVLINWVGLDCDGVLSELNYH